MTAVSAHHATPTPFDEIARTWWSWALAHGSIVVGLVATDIAIGESVDGAPTIAEQQVVDVATSLAAVLLPFGLAIAVALRRSIWSAAAWRARRLIAVVMGVAAAALGVTRVPMLLSRLLWHVSRDAGEPLTTVSLGLQVVVAIVMLGALAIFAAAEYRVASPPTIAVPQGAGAAGRPPGRATPDPRERTSS